MFLLEIHDNSSFVVFEHLLTFHFSLKYMISRLSSEDRTFQSQLDYFNRVTSTESVPVYRNFLSKPLENLFTKFEIQTFLK